MMIISLLANNVLSIYTVPFSNKLVNSNKKAKPDRTILLVIPGSFTLSSRQKITYLQNRKKRGIGSTKVRLQSELHSYYVHLPRKLRLQV